MWEKLSYFWLQASREVGAKPLAGAAVSSEDLAVAGGSASEVVRSPGCRLVDLSVGLLRWPHNTAPTSPRARGRERTGWSSHALGVIHCHSCYVLLVTQVNAFRCGRRQYKGTDLRKWGHWGPSWRLVTMVPKKTKMFLGTLDTNRGFTLQNCL